MWWRRKVGGEVDLERMWRNAMGKRGLRACGGMRWGKEDASDCGVSFCIPKKMKFEMISSSKMEYCRLSSYSAMVVPTGCDTCSLGSNPAVGTFFSWVF
jgi:hypothetical protein